MLLVLNICVQQTTNTESANFTFHYKSQNIITTNIASYTVQCAWGCIHTCFCIIAITVCVQHMQRLFLHFLQVLRFCTSTFGSPSTHAMFLTSNLAMRNLFVHYQITTVAFNYLNNLHVMGRFSTYCTMRNFHRRIVSQPLNSLLSVSV